MKLAEYTVLWDDPELLLSELDRYDAVEPADVRKAVATHLTDLRRTIVEIYPPGWVKDEYPASLQYTYIVKKGDSLIRIANQWGIALSELLKENELRRNQTIYAGQKLVIPKGGRPPRGVKRSRVGRAKRPQNRSHKVRRGDTLSELARKYGVSVRDIMRLNGIGKNKRIYIGKTLVIPPKSK